ncbi:MAG TPA: nuclear transport factor 2 family protein [Actinophytocola sp.]|jgi:ketosteroid isomerase-like protein|nr:nuclear transport factor 2 family protein [Actinophytocola sp.]
MTNDMLKRIEDYFLGRRHEPMWAPEAVIEDPFARPGQPRRYENAAAFEEATRESRESLPVRFESFRYTAVHETADPEVMVLEYELGGTVLTTGRQATAPFIAVMRVREGQIVLWREYQNKLAIAEALT